MKYAPYSFSRLSTFIQCPRKFKNKYIDKIPEESVDKTALQKGGAVHSILEHYPNKSTHKYAEMYQSVADKFIVSNLGQKYLNTTSYKEYKFGLLRDLSPTTYSDPNAIFRGVVDYIAPISSVLNLCDYKTGKYTEQKYQNYQQLLFYAIYFFQKYSNIDSIRISYIYVEHNIENDLLLERKYLDNYKYQLLELIASIEKETEFNKSVSKLCNYCSFRSSCSNS